MKRWQILTIMTLMFLVSINTVMGCKDVYDVNEDVILSDVIEVSGRDSNCTITLFNSTSLLYFESPMVMDDLLYTFNFSKLPKGIYTSAITCNYTITQYMGECKFEVDYIRSKMIIAAIILLPMLLSILFIIGAATLDNETHKALKIFLFLLSIIPFFASMHLGLVSTVKFYDFPELQDTIGSTVYWVGIMFGVIVTYFLIYIFYTAIHAAALRKKERLKY